MHKTNAANEELVISLGYGHEVQGAFRYTYCSIHSNSLSNKMDNSLLAVRDINHKYIVVGTNKIIEKTLNNKTKCSEDRIPSKGIPKVVEPTKKKGIGDRILNAVGAVKRFSQNHPVLTEVVKWVGITVTSAAVGAAAYSGEGNCGYTPADGNDTFDYDENWDSDRN